MRRADAASGLGASFAGQPIACDHTGDGEVPYRATVDSAELLVRVNDFPAEPLYSPLVNGRLECDLEDCPAPRMTGSALSFGRWVSAAAPAPTLTRRSPAASVTMSDRVEIPAPPAN
jgi:hypothetical protein